MRVGRWMDRGRSRSASHYTGWALDGDLEKVWPMVNCSRHRRRKKWALSVGGLVSEDERESNGPRHLVGAGDEIGWFHGKPYWRLDRIC